MKAGSQSEKLLRKQEYYEVKGIRCKVEGKKGQRLKVKGQRLKVKGGRLKVKGQRLKVKGQRYKVKG
jgi:hypothetical protein